MDHLACTAYLNVLFIYACTYQGNMKAIPKPPACNYRSTSWWILWYILNHCLALEANLFSFQGSWLTVPQLLTRAMFPVELCYTLFATHQTYLWWSWTKTAPFLLYHSTALISKMPSFSQTFTFVMRLVFLLIILPCRSYFTKQQTAGTSLLYQCSQLGSDQLASILDPQSDA